MINKVILIGNVGSDPDVRYVKENQPVAHVSLATTEYFTKNAEKSTVTEWHRLVMWGNLAKVAESYIVKGTQIYVEGHLHYSEYEDKNKEVKKVTEIIVNEMKLLSGTKNRPREKSQSEIDRKNKDILEGLVSEPSELGDKSGKMPF